MTVHGLAFGFSFSWTVYSYDVKQIVLYTILKCHVSEVSRLAVSALVSDGLTLLTLMASWLLE